MADSESFRAYAKINLNLDITGVHHDGEYHTVEMVMQSIDLYDTVTVERTDNSTIEINCNDDTIPQDYENIAYKSAKKFFEHCEIEESGCEIKIKKRIPVAAGLGGGSADAAAVIVALDRLYSTNLEYDELCDIAEEVGADVPFFIQGGTQLSEGKGTILTPLPDLFECYFVIVKNAEKHSTGEMYSKFDSLTDVTHPQTSLLVDAICEGEYEDAIRHFDNVFEYVWDDGIQEIKKDLIEHGADTAALSGSGPSVFGIFKEENDAQNCKEALADKYKEVYICEPIKFALED